MCYQAGEFRVGGQDVLLGELNVADGSSYEGDFVNGIIGGKGSYKWADGRVYKGEWKDGKLHGKGIYQWPDNRVYAGDFFEDEIHGFGLMMMADGSSLQGEWRFGEKVVRGTKGWRVWGKRPSTLLVTWNWPMPCRIISITPP